MSNVRTMKIFRWFLVTPAGILGWYVGVIAALSIYEIKERLCLPEYIVSGMCHASWSSHVTSVSLVLGSLISGALVVLLPTISAPAYRSRVALIAYILGLICSLYWLFYGEWVPVVWAAVGGGLMLWRTQKVLTRHSRGTR